MSTTPLFSSTPRPSRAVIFDFDGTISIGDGPVRAYARAVEREANVSGIESVLDAFRGDALDGYDAVRVVAQLHRVGDDALQRAYLASRAALATDAAPISAPDGLTAFLDAAADAGVHRVLATNAPPVRIVEALEVLGVDGRFDQIVTNVGKPQGLHRLLDELAHAGVVDVLSVGDVWRNDLAPAHELGHVTALVGSFIDDIAVPTHRAHRLEDLLPALHAWIMRP